MAELDPAGQAFATITTRDENGIPVITIAGELDLSNTAQARAAIDTALARQDQRLILELGELEYMDSSGIALLAATARQTREVELRDPSAIVRRLIELTGLDQILRMTP
jgi:anti-sigma B factor antagonist